MERPILLVTALLKRQAVDVLCIICVFYVLVALFALPRVALR